MNTSFNDVGAWSIVLIVIVLVCAWLAYREEQQMQVQFGEACRTYRRQVLMFIPGWSQWW